MANAEARYTNLKGEDLKLTLDIDRECVREVRIKGALSEKLAPEFKELESLILGKTVAEITALKRKDFNTLNTKTDTVALLSLWMLNRALENYTGSEAFLTEGHDRLCLCFGVGLSDLRKQILKRADYELKHLIAETFATSACGSCLRPIQKAMEELRLSHGMLEGLAHSKGRLDKNGNWVKVKGLYPGPLLVLLDDLKKDWMKREGIAEQFSLELIHIEGLHLSVKASALEKTLDQDRGEKILQALTDYYKSKTGVLFFLHLFL
jgi:bacterioferritin-associated ferredoxin